MTAVATGSQAASPLSTTLGVGSEDLSMGNHCFSGPLPDVVLPFIGRLVSTRCSWHGHTGTSPGLSSHGLDGGTGSSGICPCGLASCTQ